MKTLEKTAVAGENTGGRIHPTYCPYLHNQCTSDGVSNCIEIIDESQVMDHPDYTACSRYHTIKSTK
jgi:hypothetical protein